MSDDVDALLRDAVLPTDLKRSIERALAASRERARMSESLLGSMSEGVVVCDRSGRFIYFNAAAERVLGFGISSSPAEEWAREYGVFLPDRTTPFPKEQYPLLRALEGLETNDVQQFIRNAKVPGGIFISVNGRPWKDEGGELRGAIAVFRDVTELRKAQEELGALKDTLEARVREATEELRRTESQLRQAQKMEAMGRLAGGVAHDFNNLLTVINGYGEMLLAALGPGDPKRGDLEEIVRAGERASGLTRQLLAFSRKQASEPEVLHLNETLSALEKMLRRLLGDDVELALAGSPELWPVYANRGHIEQVVMNLAVNARDAMPRGGKLTIETANVEIDEAYVRVHPQARPGPHVRISIADTGIGMDPETMQRLFEPFFTTKEPGKGTGLGLSTVHGIVRQSGGHVEVYSEPGKGSTFKVYLPRSEKGARPEREARLPLEGKKGSETILIAEDSDTVRKLCEEILRASGYRPLAAKNGEDALRVAGSHAGPIHLLLSDTVMPGIGGAELGVHLTRLRPGLRVIFMSGYTDRGAQEQGLLVEGAAFLEKPFTRQGLLGKVREVLDAP